MEPARLKALTVAAFVAFEADAAATPAMSLRAGNALDDGAQPTPNDKQLDAPTDNYLEQYYWGLPHLDAASWRNVLPFLLGYALRHLETPSNVVDALLNSLRPPDRTPPRLGSLSLEQEQIVSQVLGACRAFTPTAMWR